MSTALKSSSQQKHVSFSLLLLNIWASLRRMMDMRADSTFTAESANVLWAQSKSDSKRRAYKQDLWHQPILVQYSVWAHTLTVEQTFISVFWKCSQSRRRNFIMVIILQYDVRCCLGLVWYRWGGALCPHYYECRILLLQVELIWTLRCCETASRIFQPKSGKK